MKVFSALLIIMAALLAITAHGESVILKRVAIAAAPQCDSAAGACDPSPAALKSTHVGVCFAAQSAPFVAVLNATSQQDAGDLCRALGLTQVVLDSVSAMAKVASLLFECQGSSGTSIPAGWVSGSSPFSSATSSGAGSSPAGSTSTHESSPCMAVDVLGNLIEASAQLCPRLRHYVAVCQLPKNAKSSISQFAGNDKPAKAILRQRQDGDVVASAEDIAALYSGPGPVLGGEASPTIPKPAASSELSDYPSSSNIDLPTPTSPSQSRDTSSSASIVSGSPIASSVPQSSFSNASSSDPWDMLTANLDDFDDLLGHFDDERQLIDDLRDWDSLLGELEPLVNDDPLDESSSSSPADDPVQLPLVSGSSSPSGSATPLGSTIPAGSSTPVGSSTLAGSSSSPIIMPPSEGDQGSGIGGRSDTPISSDSPAPPLTDSSPIGDIAVSSDDNNGWPSGFDSNGHRIPTPFPSSGDFGTMPSFPDNIPSWPAGTSSSPPDSFSSASTPFGSESSSDEPSSSSDSMGISFESDSDTAPRRDSSSDSWPTPDRGSSYEDSSSYSDSWSTVEESGWTTTEVSDYSTSSGWDDVSSPPSSDCSGLCPVVPDASGSASPQGSTATPGSSSSSPQGSSGSLPSTAGTTSMNATCPMAEGLTLAPFHFLGYHLIQTPMPFEQAACACARFGMRPAEVNFATQWPAALVVFQGSSARSIAWVDNHMAASSFTSSLSSSIGGGSDGCLALKVPNLTLMGHYVLPQSCQRKLPVLCQGPILRHWQDVVDVTRTLDALLASMMPGVFNPQQGISSVLRSMQSTLEQMSPIPPMPDLQGLLEQLVSKKKSLLPSGPQSLPAQQSPPVLKAHTQTDGFDANSPMDADVTTDKLIVVSMTKAHSGAEACRARGLQAASFVLNALPALSEALQRAGRQGPATFFPDTDASRACHHVFADGSVYHQLNLASPQVCRSARHVVCQRP